MFDLKNLDQRTRQLMLDEIELDIVAGTLYQSPRLNSIGQRDYPMLLKEAAANHDIPWLTGEIRSGRLNATEQRRKPSGGYTTVTVGSNAAQMLAEGEFNRFYARALCRRAVAESISSLIVYRAKPVGQPRAQSVAMIGKSIDPRQLLADLRIHQGMDTALGLPAGPNSGLSVKLP